MEKEQTETHEITRFVCKTIIVIVGVTIVLVLLDFIDVPADMLRLKVGLPVCSLRS